MEADVQVLLSEPVLEEAARRYRAGSCDLKLLGDFENFVYEFTIDGENAILRLTHSSHRDSGQVEAELDWVGYLASCGASVARPRTSDSGRLVEEVPVADGSFLVTSFERAPGAPLRREDMETLWNAGLFCEWGRAIGRMHAVTRSYRPAEGRGRRRQWHRDRVLEDAEELAAGEPAVLERGAELVRRIAELPRSYHNFGLIHGDVHPGNFFIDRGRITVFDFDDASYHFFASDIAIAIYYALWLLPESEDRVEFSGRFLEAFLTGYRRENDLLRQEDLATIPLFLQLRDLTLYLTLKLKWDPANMSEGEQKLVSDVRQRIEAGVACVELASLFD